MKTIQERIMEKVEKSVTGCWIFTGALNNKGYGKIYLRTVNKKTIIVQPHRVMYETHNGEIPKGKNVCHSCDTPACCNPDHLFVGTQKDNLHDMTDKGRRAMGESLSESIQKGWTPELRQCRADQTRERMRLVHEEKARQAGVPLDWKYCPNCHNWYPRSNFRKNGARHDGLKCLCKPCDSQQSMALRKRHKLF
jgi:hypothetical protein